MQPLRPVLPSDPVSRPGNTDNAIRFDTGMSVGEAIRCAERWWDRRGRHLFRNPALRDPDQGLPSGILRGLAWDQLDCRERVSVVRHWHHFFVRMPHRNRETTGHE